LQAHYKQCYEHSLLCHRKMLWLLNPAAINMVAGTLQAVL